MVRAFSSTVIFIIHEVVFLLPSGLLSAPLQQEPLRSSSGQRASYSGTIRDEQTKLPLAGASVHLTDLMTGAVSDNAGHFIIRNIPSGRHFAEISYVGYASRSFSVEVNGDLVQDLLLSPSILESNEVVVTGVSMATEIRRSPVPISIIKQRELSRITASGLVDLISHEPGISQVSTGPAIAKPVIRGLGFNRVVVLNDGIRQEGQQWGDEHGLEVDEYSVQKVEILKGPASVMYGSDALAGVLQLITNSPVPQGTIKGSFTSQYQGNNRFVGSGLQLGGYGVKGFNWNVYGTLKSAADYKNRYDGRVYNSRFNEQNAGGYMGWNGAWGHSHLLFSSYDQKAGIIEGDRDDAGNFLRPLPGGGSEVPDTKAFDSRNPDIPRQHILHKRYISDNNFHIGPGRLSLTLGWQRNQRMEYGNAAAPEERELYFDLNTFTYNTAYHFKSATQWNISAGLSGMAQQNKNRGERSLIPDYLLHDIGAFLFTSKTIHQLSVSGGLRYDNRKTDSRQMMEGNEVKITAFIRRFSNASGTLGLSYTPSSSWVFKWNLARGFRAPSIAELASNGAHEGTNRYEYGSRDLRSETSWQTDLGIEYSAEHVSVASSFFYNDIQGFIFYRKLPSAIGGDSLITDAGGTYIAFAFDQRKVRLYGGELRVDLHPHPLDWLHVENSFSWVIGNFREPIAGDRDLPFLPAARLLSEVRGEWKKASPWLQNAYMKIEMDHNFSQGRYFEAYDTETRTPAYTLFNLGFGADLHNKGKQLLSLYLSVKNITDVAYQNHLSRLKYTALNPATGRMGVFNMGRNFSVRVNIPLFGKLRG